MDKKLWKSCLTSLRLFFGQRGDSYWPDVSRISMDIMPHVILSAIFNMNVQTSMVNNT